MALYRSPLTVTLWPSSFLKKYEPMIPPAHKAHQTNPDIISACEVKPEDPYRGSVRLVRLQAASNNSAEPLNNAGCNVTLQNSSGVIVSSEDPNKRMCPEEMKDATENQIVCSDGEYQFVTHRTVPLKQQIYVSANSDGNSQMPDATFHSMLQHDISSSTDTSNALYEHIVFSNSENSVSDFSIPRIDRVESSPSPDITSSTWIMNSVNNNESNGTSIRENESSVLQYHQNSQETSENSQSSANLSEIPDTQQMQRFITADNQVVYGYKDPNGEFHFFCPAMNERESHNEKERKRRKGRESVKEGKRSGRLQTFRTAENIEKISAAVRKNRLQIIAESVGISPAACEWILKDLDMHRVCQHIVPRIISFSLYIC
ncbi:BHLH domain-containing protein [Trichonephila clavipes]|uniref:BHLH domain-containing protein n=1 Tax=Trichonephila clavipes TaxID=2585209 RepID=A0A8X7BJA9_TRICX|nr:BHLH domain-containing protein [Trichonephila clavipes]